MAMDDSKPQRYYIPDNFLGESKILKGAFKTRNFLEGVALMIIPLFIALIIPVGSLDVKIVLMIFFTAPFFLVGLAGFNGDPLSAVVVSLYGWAENKDVMIYNKKAKVLTGSPLDNMMSETPNKDKILTYLEQKREMKRMTNSQKTYVEGIDFEFEDEKDAYIKYADVHKKDRKGSEKDGEEFYVRDKLVSDNDSIIKENSDESGGKNNVIASTDVEMVDVVEVEDLTAASAIEELVSVEAVEVPIELDRKTVYKADFSVVNVEEVEVSEVFV